jgi:hypothetical protein
MAQTKPAGTAPRRSEWLPVIVNLLAMAWIALLFGCHGQNVDDRGLLTSEAKTMDSTDAAASPARREWLKQTTVTRIQVWSSSSVILYPSDQPVTAVADIDAAYQFHTSGSQPDIRYDAVVFINPASGHIWAGPRTDYYIDTDGGILGLWVLEQEVRWFGSSIKAVHPGDTLQSLALRFEQQKIYLQLVNWPTQSSNLGGFVHDQFFEASPGSANGAAPHVETLEVRNGTLHLSLASPTYVFHTNILLDVKHRSLIKAADDDGAEAPASILQHLIRDIPQLRPPPQAPGSQVDAHAADNQLFTESDGSVDLFFDGNSVAGYYRLRDSPSTGPATWEDADLIVTLRVYENGDDAMKGFRELIAARTDQPPPAESISGDTAICHWLDGRTVAVNWRRIVDIQPKVKLPQSLSDALLKACLNRMAVNGASGTGQAQEPTR